jgi:hypothetical protein
MTTPPFWACTLSQNLVAEGAVVEHRPIRGGILKERTEELALELDRSMISHDDFDAQRERAGLQHVERLGVAGLRGEERFALLGALDLEQHRHRFSGGSGLVEQRGVCDLQPGKIDHDRLEIEQGLQPPLRNFRLVRRVGCVPARVLEDVPEDDRGRDAIGVTHSDERFENLVPGRDGLQLFEKLMFSLPLRQSEGMGQPDCFGNRFFYQLSK